MTGVFERQIRKLLPENETLMMTQVGDKEAHRPMVGESGGGGTSQGQHPNNNGNAQGRGGQQQNNRRQLQQRNDQQQQQQPRGNPYAALLQATKIELLETHKNSQVAKRYVCFFFSKVGRMWLVCARLLLAAGHEVMYDFCTGVPPIRKCRPFNP